MIRVKWYIYSLLVLPVTVFSSHLFAAECTIDSNTLDRGETKAFIICGKNIPRNYILKGFSEANITIAYEQYLERCAIGNEAPGIYLILRAEDDATTASVRITHADTEESLREPINVTVSDRIHIQKATLEDLPDTHLPFKLLTIKGDTSHDLSQACSEELSFPKGTWPSLSLVTREEIGMLPSAAGSDSPFDETPVCSRSSIQALVNVQGQQRYPAKVILSKVRLKEGKGKEGVAYVTLPRPAWTSAMKDEDAKYVDVGGIRTRYFEKGKGDALLFVHEGQAGATGNAQTWEQNFDYLARSFHVFALDRLGQGYTDNPKTDKEYDEYYERVVDHVWGFIKAMGIKTVHLVGHSQGGWPVMRVALDHPEMVKSLVVLNSGMAPSGPEDWKMAFYMYISFYVDPPVGPTPESIRRGMEFWSYARNNITTEKVERDYRLLHLPKMIEAREQMKKHYMNPAHPSFQEGKNKVLEEIKEGKLKVPTLIVWGYNDPSLPYQVGMKLFEYVSASVLQSQLHMFNNCGHHAYMEYPEQFNKLIKAFCGSNTFLPPE